MELIKISNEKLKITLSPEDMAEYGINCDTADYGRTETRRAFWHLLDEVKHKTGFDSASDRVYIQLYPSRDGGCEMFVTKLADRAEQAPLASGSAARRAFIFPDVAAVIGACRALSARHGQMFASAYSAEDGSLLLLLDGDPPAFLSEFGKEVDARAAVLGIPEHFKKLTDDAIGALAAL